MKDEKTKKIVDNMSIIYESKKADDIYIDFQNILKINKEEIDLSMFCKFNIKKRTFKNRIEELYTSIVNLLEELELDDTNFYDLYLSFSILMKTTNESQAKYLAVTNEILDTLHPKVVKFIDTKVDADAYRVRKTLDEINTVSKKELYFSDIHLKRLLSVIVYAKILFPMMDSLENDSTKNQKIKTKIQELVWNRPYCPEDNSSAINKVQKLVCSRLLNTIYSDKRFWTLAKLHDINPHSHANTLTNKIITEMIAIVNYDANPIPFLDVYLKQNIQWLSKKNFTVSFNVVNTYQQDKKFDLLQEKAHISANNNVMANFLINEEIMNFLALELGHFKTDKFYMDLYNLVFKNYTRNIIHLYILFPLISKKLGISTERLLLVNKATFSALIVYAVKILSDNNFILLCNLLLSNIDSDKTNIDKAKVTNYKTIKEIKDSEHYKATISKKYHFFEETMEEEDFIIRIIAVLFYNKFTSFTDNKVLKYTVKELGDEFLRFLNIML